MSLHPTPHTSELVKIDRAVKKEEEGEEEEGEEEKKEAHCHIMQVTEMALLGTPQ